MNTEPKIESVRFNHPIKVGEQKFPDISMRSGMPKECRYLESLMVNMRDRLVIFKVKGHPIVRVPLENVSSMTEPASPEVAHQDEKHSDSGAVPVNQEEGPDWTPDQEAKELAKAQKRIAEALADPATAEQPPEAKPQAAEPDAPGVVLSGETDAQIYRAVDRMAEVAGEPTGIDHIKAEIEKAKALPRGKARTNAINRARRALRKAKAARADK